MRKFLNTVFFVAAILFFVIFALSNTQTIQLSFLHLQLKPFPASLVILISFLAGVVLGSLLNLVDRISMKREVRRLKKDIRDKEALLYQKNNQPDAAPRDSRQEGSVPRE